MLHVRSACIYNCILLHWDAFKIKSICLHAFVEWGRCHGAAAHRMSFNVKILKIVGWESWNYSTGKDAKFIPIISLEMMQNLFQ